MYRVQNLVGRLVEIWIASPVSREETVPWARDHDRVIEGVAGPYVCFVDLRRATVFPPDVVDAYVKTMKNEPHLCRTGTLLPASPTFGMQIERMIRDAASPDRRAFRHRAPLERWLGEMLTPAERERLRALCDEE